MREKETKQDKKTNIPKVDNTSWNKPPKRIKPLTEEDLKKAGIKGNLL